MAEPWSPEWRQDHLNKLHKEWKRCEKCPELVAERNKIVFGNGNPAADVMFIGTAPGVVEDEVGKPFKGPSGEFINAILKGAGYNREDFYFTNIICCHPPEDRDPSKQEKEACVKRLHQEIYIVDPMLIVLIGKVAAISLLGGRESKIEKLQGKIKTLRIPGIRQELEYDALVIYHPAHILREERPVNGVYPPGSKAQKTNAAVQRSLDVVKRLKSEYEKFAGRFE